MALVCDVYCEFVTFPLGILGEVWYLIVSITDPCCLSYFDIETTIRDSLDCKDSRYCYQPAGYIVTGILKIITDSLYVRTYYQDSFVNRFQECPEKNSWRLTRILLSLMHRR